MDTEVTAMNEIKKETFEKMSVNLQMLVIFDYVHSIHEFIKNQPAICDTRIKKIEKSRPIDLLYSGIGGLIGGFIAIIAKIKFIDP
jgi:hypothetical protein